MGMGPNVFGGMLRGLEKVMRPASDTRGRSGTDRLSKPSHSYQFTDEMRTVNLEELAANCGDERLFEVRIEVDYEGGGEAYFVMDRKTLPETDSGLLVTRYSETVGVGFTIKFSNSATYHGDFSGYYEPMPEEAKEIKKIIMSKHRDKFKPAWASAGEQTKARMERYYAPQEPGMGVLMDTISTEFKRAKAWFDHSRRVWRGDETRAANDRAWAAQGFLRALMRALGKKWDNYYDNTSSVPIFQLVKDMPSARFSRFDQEIVSEAIRWLERVNIDHLPFPSQERVLTHLDPMIQLFQTRYPAE